ncbi:homoserine kinase [Flavobacteriaceae bacterium F08102]|nr:homoserine kinase [Flavobacteriaceae bacterium F08102]
MERIKLFSPATVANVSCGFDALGFAMDTVGDEMILYKSRQKGVRITKIEGANLSDNPKKNVAGVVAFAMLKALNSSTGIEIEMYKKVKPGSGLGSSASSAAGTAFGINELFGRPFSILQLTEFARLGEVAACGAPIADNVAAALYGGFILVQSYEPLSIVKLPVPDDLWATVIHPQIEIKTEDARSILPPQVSMQQAVRQAANLGGLVSGLYEGDFQRISDSLIDYLAEPHRKKLIPHFEKLKSCCIQHGALGVGISGSGPSIFALSSSESTGKQLEEQMAAIYRPTEIDFHLYTSQINQQGMKILAMS